MITVAAMETFINLRCLARGRQLLREGMFLGTCVPLSNRLWHVLRIAVVHILPLHAAALLYPIS